MKKIVHKLQFWIMVLIVMVRKAKNEEWLKLGERMEKSSMANQRENARWMHGQISSAA